MKSGPNCAEGSASALAVGYFTARYAHVFGQELSEARCERQRGHKRGEPVGTTYDCLPGCSAHGSARFCGELHTSRRTDLGSKVLDLERVAALHAKLAERLCIVVKQLLVRGGDALAVDVELWRTYTAVSALIRSSDGQEAHLDFLSDGRLERSDGRGVLVELYGEREALRGLGRARLDSHSERHRASSERSEDNLRAARLTSSLSPATA